MEGDEATRQPKQNRHRWCDRSQKGRGAEPAKRRRVPGLIARLAAGLRDVALAGAIVDRMSSDRREP